MHRGVTVQARLPCLLHAGVNVQADAAFALPPVSHSPSLRWA